MNKKQEILEFITKKTKPVASFKVLTLTGSALEKESVTNMDFLLLIDSDISEKEFLAVIEMNLYSKYRNCYTFNFDGLLANITVVELEKFNEYYENIFYGKNIDLSYSNWCLGYFIPEAFLGDIRDSRVIFEKISYSLKYIEVLDNYPVLLQQEIIKSSLHDLNVIKNLFYKSLDRNNAVAIWTSMSEIFFVSFRALFAKEGVYYRGLFDLDSCLLLHPELGITIKKLNENILDYKMLRREIDNYLIAVNQILS